jgi:hypothetical protein
VTTPARDENVLELDAPSWARVEKVSLIRREIRESLSPNAVELLFARAEKVVESGQDSSGDAVYATVMVTIDLSQLEALAREPADAATAHRLVELVQKDRGVASRMKQFARPYLCELAESSVDLKQIKIDLRVRSEAATLLIDADAMVSLERTSVGAPKGRGRP